MEKVGKTVCQSACVRVGKLSVVPGVSLGQQEQTGSSARPGVMLLTRTPGEQAPKVSFLC